MFAFSARVAVVFFAQHRLCCNKSFTRALVQRPLLSGTRGRLPGASWWTV